MRSTNRRPLGSLFAVLIGIALCAVPIGAPAAASGAAPIVATAAPLHATGAVATPGLRPGISAVGMTLQAKAASYPTSVDLTAWVPPVGNQGQVGSCTSWATGYYERYWLRNHALGDTTTYAPMYLYSQIAQGVDRGSSFSSNFNIMINQGISPSGVYTQGSFDYTSQPTTAEQTAAASYKASSYAYIFSGASSANQGAIQAAMAAGSPVMLAIPVYPEFDNANTANPLVVPPSAGESSRGLHAVFAPKYDANGVWIENSWGTWWGASGWAELSWAFINQYAVEGWTFSSSTTDVSGGTTASIDAFNPTSTAPGSLVTVTGKGFTGASGVSFNGAASPAFTVDSDTSITAAVPTSATTGPIAVATPAGTATSAAAFVVSVVTTPTATTLRSGSTSNAVAGGGVTLKATLKTTGNVAVAGMSVSFSLNGTTYTATTSGTGVALVNAVAPSSVGSYPIGISFSGDATYAASSASATLRVVLPTPVVRYSGPTSATRGTSVTLSATLRTSGGLALAGRTLSFTLNNVTSWAVTDGSGVASVVMTVPNTGPVRLTVKFAGDAGYAAASANGNLRAV